jgi:prepilin-type N-terminal cleavage/methylation domain-containing protein
MINLLDKKRNKGFTLMELITVVGIFAIITTVVMIKFSTFNNKILTTNLAYDIALSIREAQTFGVNVRGFDTGNTVVFDYAYGVHFNESSDTTYTFFIDLNGNGKFESNNETVDVFTLRGGHRIERLCRTTGASVTSCSDTTPSFNDLYITFKRPEPDAVIKSNGSTLYQSASIRVTSPQGIDREIQVHSTGQISIVNNP